MEHNAYDFDKTIYLKDSTAKFYFFCLKKYPLMMVEWPLTAYYFVLYSFGACSKTRFKEKMYRFLRHVKDISDLVELFWAERKSGMADFYQAVHRRDDIIISASPEFLLRPICTFLEVDHLICSKVDPFTGIYNGKNCYGEEKVLRLQTELPGITIGKFYSDSLSDAPMANLAKEAFLVKKGEVIVWPGKCAF